MTTDLFEENVRNAAFNLAEAGGKLRDAGCYDDAIKAIHRAASLLHCLDNWKHELNSNKAAKTAP